MSSLNKLNLIRSLALCVAVIAIVCCGALCGFTMLKSNAEEPVIGTLDQLDHFVISDDGELTDLSSAGKAIAAGCTELHVVIPDGVASITDATTLLISRPIFYDYRTKLKSVILPDGLTTIGEYAFWNCTKLISVELPATLTTIGKFAFYLCSSLPSIDLSQTKITELPTSCFNGCTSLTSVKLPDALTTLGASAFYNCSSLPSIELPDTLTTIGGNAFYGCSSLTSIELPDNLTTIGTYAFYNCSSLPSIDLSQTKITQIPDYCFSKCESLTGIELPDTLTTIGGNAFYNCSSLPSIDLSQTKITQIPDYCFSKCESLTGIELPATLTIVSASLNAYNSPFFNCQAVLICPDAEVVNNYKNGVLKTYASKLTYQIGWQINLTDHNGKGSVIAEKTLVGENFANWHYIDGAWVEDPDYVATELQALPALPNGCVWEDEDSNELTVEIVQERIAAAQTDENLLTINAKAVGDPIIDEPEPVDPTPDQPENPDDDDDQTPTTPDEDDSGDQTPSGNNLPWWIWLAIGGSTVGVGGITTAVVFMIKKKALKI